MGNPPIYPLIYNSKSNDILIVHINPIERNDIPKDPSAIMDRVNEISFNSSLMLEMRAIAFVTDLIENKQIKGRPLRKMFIHAIEGENLMRTLGTGSKLNPEWSFLKRVRDEGSSAGTRLAQRSFQGCRQDVHGRYSQEISLTRFSFDLCSRCAL